MEKFQFTLHRMTDILSDFFTATFTFNFTFLNSPFYIFLRFFTNYLLSLITKHKTDCEKVLLLDNDQKYITISI